MSVQTDKTSQIRLLIPTEMVKELDTIAISRSMSRLALIRYFLRHQIDQELSELDSYLSQVERRKQTHQRLQEHLSERER